MKTRLFVILCLFMTMSWTRTYAQLIPENGVQGWGIDYGYFTPAYCNGEMVDNIEGTIEFHFVFTFKHGVLSRLIIQGNGKAAGESGEVFKVSERDFFDFNDGTLVWKCNLKGNWGSHYIGTFVMDLNTGEIIVGKAFCPGGEHD